MPSRLQLRNGANAPDERQQPRSAVGSFPPPPFIRSSSHDRFSDRPIMKFISHFRVPFGKKGVSKQYNELWSRTRRVGPHEQMLIKTPMDMKTPLLKLLLLTTALGCGALTPRPAAAQTTLLPTGATWRDRKSVV